MISMRPKHFFSDVTNFTNMPPIPFGWDVYKDLGQNDSVSLRVNPTDCAKAFDCKNNNIYFNGHLVKTY